MNINTVIVIVNCFFQCQRITCLVGLYNLTLDELQRLLVHVKNEYLLSYYVEEQYNFQLAESVILDAIAAKNGNAKNFLKRILATEEQIDKDNTMILESDTIGQAFQHRQDYEVDLTDYFYELKTDLGDFIPEEYNYYPTNKHNQL